MTASDFSSWAVLPLVLTLGERTYTVAPPNVGDMGKLIACAVLGEVKLGLADGPVPEQVQAVLDTIAPDEHPALGEAVYAQMVADNVHPTTIDRMAYYSVFYWAKGKDYADGLALLLWGREQAELAEAENPAPKG
ncbi:hypothetical protein [Microbacterium sp. Root280D1]|uniref:DUF7426 family protein n=1 Tax=Microbacterium sp. Root280D1 TaxID=1736510 RepID=UPI0006FCB28C|nr:hypothetical protein [Microbacterium sp. Root280D1]KRD51964.1 hypothetical protein ASE34_08590 [Microbacterium sp. Root280D1]